MDKLNKMAVFARVVELGSFAAAAADMNVSPAIVGRHVADLESMLNQRLLNRSTRSMVITEAGRRYYDGCKSMLDQMTALEQDVAGKHGQQPSGVIRLVAPEGIGSPFLLAAIESFQNKYPDVFFDLILDNERTDFVAANVDLAIRFANEIEDRSLIVSKLDDTRLALFAAPSYLKARGTPKTAADLADHACLFFGTSRLGNAWPILSGQGMNKIRLSWTLICNQTHVYLDALSRGLGIGLVPEVMARELVRSERLLPIPIQELLPEIGVYALYQDKTFLPRRVSLFIEHLREQVRVHWKQ